MVGGCTECFGIYFYGLRGIGGVDCDYSLRKSGVCVCEGDCAGGGRVVIVDVHCEENVWGNGHGEDCKVGVVNVFALQSKFSSFRTWECYDQIDSSWSTDDV